MTRFLALAAVTLLLCSFIAGRGQAEPPNAQDANPTTFRQMITRWQDQGDDLRDQAVSSDQGQRQDFGPDENGLIDAYLPAPAVGAKDLTSNAWNRDGALTLADVIASLYRAYPDINRARQEANRAGGDLLAAYGGFDTKLQGYSLAEPLGVYRPYRTGIGAARQTWWGGYVAAGYRIGRGVFQPWYLERETEKGGELKLALAQPLLQGRAIDPQRLAVFQASLARQAAQPAVQQAILDVSREAAAVYWQWVANGAFLEAQRELLELAETRGEQYELGVKAGKFAEIDLILNQQLIAERRAKLIESEQTFRSTTFKLSLFLRDENGQPMIANDDWLPKQFPEIEMPPARDFQEDLASALAQRPEPRLLQLELRKMELERRVACNQMLPHLDFVAEASQDFGGPASSRNDKGEFELLIGLQGELPVQRRKARGKIQATTAKIAQVSEKLRLQQDKIGAELQTAYNALVLSAQVVDQAEVSLRAALESLERYRFAFERGKIDLIYLNLLEVKANETEIKLVEAQRNWFAALALMQASLGLDPLEQAFTVAEMPPSDRPGPGSLPPTSDVEPKTFEKDWERHLTPLPADEP